MPDDLRLRYIQRVAIWCLLASTAWQAGCGGSQSSRSPTAPSAPAAPAPQPTYTVSSFISGAASAEGSQASLKSGSAPTPTGGPAATPTGNTGVINGGSNQVRIRSNSTFQVVYIFIGAVSGGVGGYWELRLATPTNDTVVIINLSRQVPTSTFDCVYAVATTAGLVGPYGALQTRLLPASSGEVQISATWDAASDVDLHVVDPRGEEIYYGNTSSTSGGALDLDSNAACAIDGKNNENIRWPTGRAPGGTYTVRLDYWSSCGGPPTNYVVTVNNGGNTQTFRGTLTGSGDYGGSGSGRFITSFTRAGSLSAPADVVDLHNLPRATGPRAHKQAPTPP